MGPQASSLEGVGAAQEAPGSWEHVEGQRLTLEKPWGKRRKHRETCKDQKSEGLMGIVDTPCDVITLSSLCDDIVLLFQNVTASCDPTPVSISDSDLN